MNLSGLKQISYIIFDFDGVIADTDRGRFELLKNLLTEYGIILGERSTITDIRGITTQKFLKSKYPELSQAEIDRVIELRRREYMGNLQKYCIPVEGALDTIKELCEYNYNLILATSNEREPAEELLIHLGIKNNFSCIFTKEDLEMEGSPSKNYAHVLNAVGKNAEECIAIEDSPIGIMSAKEAGIPCVAFGSNCGEDAGKYAIYHASDYRELRKFFGL